ncbi:MAG TPA: hypothetical protein VGH28_27365 [Polyangiaceae bacterium]
MDTLPRFRLPDESSSRDVNAAAAASNWEDFDDLDQLETRVQEKSDKNEFDEALPTMVRPSLGRKLISRGPLRAVTAANVDDVVEELRAAAQGRKPRVRELESAELVEEGADGSGQVMDVEPNELVFDRAVSPRAMWNVRQVARPAAPSIVGPTSAPTSRFIVTAALAMLLGALLAIGAAVIVWRVTGLNL